ncbi:hypothetical protein BH23BAC4_BH23BAC4_13180 [soil metagenome]
MHLTIPVKVDRLISVEAPPDETFDLIADLPTSLASFSKTHSVERPSEDVFVWTLNEIGPARYQQHIAYACRYGSDGSHRVWWEPADEEYASGLVPPDYMTGSCDISPQESGSAAHLMISADIVLDLPRMARMLAPPLVKIEFERTIDQFVKHLKHNLGG